MICEDEGAPLEERCRALVAELRLGPAVRSVRPLTGGVASDIAAVELADRTICAKFALAKLRVEEAWFAPVRRNAAEYRWLEFAATIAPEAVPQLLGRSDALGGFAMEFVAGDDVRLWKSALLEGASETGEAAKVGAILGAIHAASSAPAFDRTGFDNAEDFAALRTEPYLTFTASRHAEVADQLLTLADAVRRADAVLVHGDVSPKNILLRHGKPIFLDAECATMGEGAFDVAFCVNHLVLKAIHAPDRRIERLRQASTLWQAYARHIVWEDEASFERRVAALVPALMLARVDGKSPVEYLCEAARGKVRRLALGLIVSPPPDIAALLHAVEAKGR